MQKYWLKGDYDNNITLKEGELFYWYYFNVEDDTEADTTEKPPALCMFLYDDVYYAHYNFYAYYNFSEKRIYKTRSRPYKMTRIPKGTTLKITQ